MNLTIIGAHPGDAEYVSGAMIHKYVAAGHHVQVILLTSQPREARILSQITGFAYVQI